MFNNHAPLKSRFRTYNMPNHDNNKIVLEYLKDSTDKISLDNDNQRLMQALNLNHTFDSVKAFERLSNKIKKNGVN